MMATGVLMGIINADFAPTATFTRPNTDADGNKAETTLGVNPVVVSDRSREAFIPRGLDRKAGDQFEVNGGKYTLAGRARGDMAHPFTGDDFGWVAFDVEFGWLGGAKATSAGRGVENSSGGRTSY